MKVLAIVGLTGSGKSEVAKIFEEKDFIKIRFGDITDEELRRRGLERNENNERYIRELLRREYGMSAYAKLNLTRIDSALKQSNVVIDGLYSWEEYTFLKSYYGGNSYLVAVWASPKTRYERLMKRPERPLTLEEAASRDIAEIENLDKSKPIAMADFLIVNESSLKTLRKEIERIVSTLKSQN